MPETFDINPSDPVFAKHKGKFPVNGLIQALEDYDKYVTKEGRNVSKENWLGTALQESGFGKYVGGWGMPPIPTGQRKGGFFLKPSSNPMNGNPDENFYNKIATPKREKDSNYNADTDFAAHKLDEGKKKFGTDEKAARWYNWYDKVPREKLPQLGKEIMSNPTVQKIMGMLALEKANVSMEY